MMCVCILKTRKGSFLAQWSPEVAADQQPLFIINETPIRLDVMM